jgi:hypothetical protein
LLKSLGYDLDDYELDKDIYSDRGFVFDFKLKEADEKTKATD